jgi:eukaryotic-like serine/threonine-protein kinase
LESLGQPSWFGQYRLTSRIATGGMAEVYLGRHISPDGRFGPLVAVKRLLPHLVKDTQIVRMFLNEARITAQIDHPNVVRVIDLGHEAGEPYICMELLDGFTLAELRRKTAEEGRRLPLGITLRVLSDACRGLDAAHGAKDEEGKPLGLVHRDFTPDNIHVGATGEVKVIDFGVAKTAAWGTGTEPGTLKGKFFYMSPEMILARPVDHRADIFAAGVMLYEELCGRRPFTGKSVDEVVLRIAEGMPKPPRAFDPSVPEALEVICLKALDREAERRFSTLQEFIHAIESVGGLATVATREQVGDFLNMVFPPDRDTKRQTLKQARAADPSQPGLGIYDANGQPRALPQETGDATQETPPPAMTPAPMPVGETSAVSLTDVNPAMQVPLGDAPMLDPEAPTMQSPIPGQAREPRPPTVPPGAQRAPGDVRNPPPDSVSALLPKRSLAPMIAGGVVLAALIGLTVFALSGATGAAPPAEALARAEAARPEERAKLLDGIGGNDKATADQLDKACALLVEAKAWDAVLQLTEAWTKREPREIRARLHEANAAARLRKGKRAEAAIAAAQDIDPKDNRADLAMADLREAQGDLGATLEALARATRRSPDDAALKRRYAMLLSQGGRTDEAATALEALLKSNYDARLAAELAFVELRRKKAPEAEAILKKALKKDAKVWEVHYYLAAVQYQKGEFAQARASYLEADKLSGDDARPLEGLCEIDAQQASPQLPETKKRIAERFPKTSAELLKKCDSVQPAQKE